MSRPLLRSSQTSAPPPDSRRDGAQTSLPSGTWEAGGAGVRCSLAAAAGSVIDLDLSMLLQLGLFLALFLILRPLLFKRLVDLFAAREKSIDGAQAEARQMEEESKKKTEAYEEAMKKVRAEANVEREKQRAEATKAANAILADARTRATAHLDDGKKAIHAEAQSLQEELGKRAREIGHELSRRLLGRDPGAAS